ncbi:MAG: hypothetical protein GY778_27675 [bacterium]|nr:hypothetical protein [bacterium]
MVNAVTEIDVVHHRGFAPGAFPDRWVASAYELHCRAWPTAWEGQLSCERFAAELLSNHVDVLCEANGSNGDGRLLAFVKWKATAEFHSSRDRLSDPAEPSLPSAPPAEYVCAYEITASPDASFRGLGRRLLSEATHRWDRDHAGAAYCTYSPKRKLSATLRRLAKTEQNSRPALEAFAHRAGAVAARHIDDWVDHLGQPLESFIRRELVPVPDDRLMTHLGELRERLGTDLVDGLVAAVGIAYHFVVRASSGLPVCGPAAFHRALGAEHWRQYPGSATNCADALGLVDHWRYSHDPERRARCAQYFKDQRLTRARRNAGPHDLLVLA